MEVIIQPTPEDCAEIEGNAVTLQLREQNFEQHPADEFRRDFVDEVRPMLDEIQ